MSERGNCYCVRFCSLCFLLPPSIMDIKQTQAHSHITTTTTTTTYFQSHHDGRNCQTRTEKSRVADDTEFLSPLSLALFHVVCISVYLLSDLRIWKSSLNPSVLAMYSQVLHRPLPLKYYYAHKLTQSHHNRALSLS